MATINYNKTTDEVQKAFTCIPAGEYQAVMEDSDYGKNKKNTGMLFSAKFQIIDGPQKGRKLFDNFHLEHENQQAKQIGERRFNSIKKSTGVHNPSDTKDFHNIPLKIIVGVEKDDVYGDENGNKNIIKGYKPLSENGNPATSSSPTQGDGGKQPWE